MAKDWIAGAIKHKGSLSRSAHAVGMSPMQFAREHKHSPGTAGKRSRLAITLSKMGSGGIVMSGDVAEATKETVRGAKKPFSYKRYRS